jgi:hypothetical protein
MHRQNEEDTMLTIRTERAGRTWYGRPAYKVVIEDATGRITFGKYPRKDAEFVADVARPLVGDRPIGKLANEIARMYDVDPIPGEIWCKDF